MQKKCRRRNTIKSIGRIMRTVKVSTSKEYDVLIGENLLTSTGSLVSKVRKPCKAAIISDDIVFSLYGETVKKSLTDVGFTVCEYVFANGEKSKTLTTFASILEFLAENKITRTDIVIALGGGVVGDIAGFSAAAYLRGIDFVQIPTSLLAAVDSSVGGKTAVDLNAGKNLAGAFHQPILVICDTKAFDTLDSRQVSCGFAEIIKYAVMCDTELFEQLEEDKYDYVSLVERCIKIKRDIVQRDEFDRGERKLLNLGHTLRHAVEKHSEFSLTHGEAVAIGLVMISHISEVKGYAKEPVLERISELLKKYGLPTDYKIKAETLFKISTGDKKIEGSTITPVIPTKIGDCILENLSLDEFRKLTDIAVKK